MPELAKGGEAFPERRHAGYRAFCRETFPCVAKGLDWHGVLPSGKVVRFSHHCGGIKEFMHLENKGHGGEDIGNGLIGCTYTHQWQHEVGLASWAAGFGWSLDDLDRMAKAYVPVWERAVLGVHTTL